MSAARAHGGGTPWWWDARLWTLPLVGAGVAGALNRAWSTLVPAREPPTLAVAAAGALTALASALPAAWPAARTWFGERGRTPPVVPLLLAWLLPAPPGAGWRSALWTVAVLLFVWVRSDQAAGAWRGRAPAQVDAWLGPLWSAGLWIALVDLGLPGPGAAWTADRLGWAAMGATGALAVAAASACRAAVRRAEAEGARVLPGFGRAWAGAAVPAVALALAVGAAWPPYPAPLQRGGLQRLVVAVARRFTNPSTAVAHGSGGPAAVILVAGCLAVLALGWPGQGLLVRRRPAADVLPPLGAVLRAWWRRLWARLVRRPPARGHGTWRPLPAAAARGRADGWASAPPAPRPAGARARVRAAYAEFLAAAARLGLGRALADTPRRYLARVARRVEGVRPSLAALTEAYERARWSPHEVSEEAAEHAEVDARAARYALEWGLRLRAGPAHQPPPTGGRRRPR